MVKTHAKMFIWYQLMHNTFVYKRRERKLSHGHNDVSNALKTTFLSQTTVNFV